MLVIAIILPVFGHEIGHLAFSQIGYSYTFESIWNYIRWALSSLVIFLVVIIIYYFAPNKRLHLQDVWIGAVFATITWQLVSYGFSYYVNNFGNYTATYGSIGGIIVLLLWFFLSGLTLIIGGEVNATITVMRKKY
jgi:membrane protein